MTPFANRADLVAWLPSTTTVPTDPEATRLLTRASELVADKVLSGYAVTQTGAPAVTTVAAALRDATCAQVEAWMENGEEHDIAGYPRNTAIGGTGLSVSALPSELAPRARRLLRAEGLLDGVAR